MEFLEFLLEESLVLIPVLLILGKLFKQTPGVKDWLIPYVLLVVGVGLSLLIMGLNVDAVVQGVLVTGSAVFGHQLIKQAKTKEMEDHE